MALRAEARLGAAVAAVVLCAAAGSARAAAPPTPAGEAAVLDRFVGDWRTETTVRNAAGEVIAHTRGGATGVRALGGRWVEFRSASVPPGEADLQLMTYDPVARVLRQWVFDADGYWHTADGRWDPKRETITWRGEKDGATLLIEDRWRSPDHLDWSLVRRAADGTTLQTISGTVTREK